MALFRPWMDARVFADDCHVASQVTGAPKERTERVAWASMPGGEQRGVALIRVHSTQRRMCENKKPTLGTAVGRGRFSRASSVKCRAAEPMAGRLT